jgi:hypothetical protein
MYHGGSWNATHWLDTSGNDMHVAQSRGTGVLSNSESRGGVVDIEFLYGASADGFRFPTAFAWNNWTLFHISRCVGQHSCHLQPPLQLHHWPEVTKLHCSAKCSHHGHPSQLDRCVVTAAAQLAHRHVHASLLRGSTYWALLWPAGNMHESGTSLPLGGRAGREDSQPPSQPTRPCTCCPEVQGPCTVVLQHRATSHVAVSCSPAPPAPLCCSGTTVLGPPGGAYGTRTQCLGRLLTSTM